MQGLLQDDILYVKVGTQQVSVADRFKSVPIACDNHPDDTFITVDDGKRKHVSVRPVQRTASRLR